MAGVESTKDLGAKILPLGPVRILSVTGLERAEQSPPYRDSLGPLA